MKKLIIASISITAIMLAGMWIFRPKPEPLFVVVFTDSNVLGIDVPFMKEDELVYRTKTRPMRTQILGGSRYSFVDENGNLIELKGSYDFEVVQIGWIEVDDPRHGSYSER